MTQSTQGSSVLTITVAIRKHTTQDGPNEELLRQGLERSKFDCVCPCGVVVHQPGSSEEVLVFLEALFHGHDWLNH
jgi:hypothetical protein